MRDNCFVRDLRDRRVRIRKWKRIFVDSSDLFEEGGFNWISLNVVAGRCHEGCAFHLIVH